MILRSYLRSLGSVAIAFSGGVDSSLLLKVAKDELGDKVLAVTATSCAFPRRELLEAQSFTKEYDIKHIVFVSEELDIDGFSNNPVNRCYLCKKELFSKIIEIAKENKIKYVAEGSNTDDDSDYRPGLMALSELKILSPLKEVKLTKSEIRELSREMGLATWEKPSFACLSSRLPYGEKITKEKLQMIDEAEQILIDLGFKQVRVRHHGSIARIEVLEEDIEKFINSKIRKKVNKELKKLGFAYICLDIEGYRTGSMNEQLGMRNEE